MANDDQPVPMDPAGGDGIGGGRGSSPVTPEPVAEPGESRVSAVRRTVSSRRRRRVEGGRPHKVTVRFSDEEFEAVALHAAAARMSVPHYVALRALDAPSRSAGSSSGGDRVMDLATMRTWATEMFSVRRELNRVGINLNQIARLLNGTGEVARGADRTLAATEATVERIGPITDWLLDTSGIGRP